MQHESEKGVVDRLKVGGRCVSVGYKFALEAYLNRGCANHEGESGGFAIRVGRGAFPGVYWDRGCDAAKHCAGEAGGA